MQKIVSVLSRHRLLTVIVGLIVFYLLFAYFAVNPIAKRAVPWVAEKYLGSQATVKSVKFDPLRLKTNIEQLKLTRQNGDHLFGFDHLLVDVEASGLLDLAWKFKEITITKPVVNVEFSKAGTLNWSELTDAISSDKKQEVDEASAIPRIILSRIAILNGEVNYADANRDTPVKTSLSPIDFSLDGFSTLPNDSGAYHITAVLPQQTGEIEWTGDLTATPLVSNGQLALKHIVLPKVLELIPDLNLPLQTKQGLVDLNFDYDFSLIKHPPVEQVSADDQSVKVMVETPPTINLTLNNVALALHDLTANFKSASQLSSKLLNINAPTITLNIEDSTDLTLASLSAGMDDITLTPLNINTDVQLLTLPHIGVNEVAFNLTENKLSIGEVLLNQGVIHAAKDQTGLLNWQAAFAGQAVEETPKPTAENDAATTGDIQTAVAPALQATSVEVSPQSISTPSDQPADAVPAATPFKLAIADIKFNHWQADFNDATYVNPLTLNINDINIGLSVGLDDQGFVIDKLNTVLNKITADSTLTKKPVLTLSDIKLDDSRINLNAKTVEINTIIASQLRTQVIHEKSQNINWQTILKTNPAPMQTTLAKAATAEAQWAVSLKKLALHKASIHIEDQTPAVPLQLDIEQGAIEISNISQNLKKALPLKLGFKVKQGGVFNLRGKVNPSPLKTDLKLNLNHFSLKPFAPYINQVALLKLNDGSASINGRLKLSQTKALTGNFKGGFSVDDLAVVEEANDAPFLTWLRVSSDDVALAIGPNALTMGHLTLVKPASKFIIYEDKSMNVTRMLRSEQGKTNSEKPSQADIASPVTKQTSAAPSNSLIAHNSHANTDTTQKVTATKTEPTVAAFPINIETINIEEAELEFADLSLRPQFGAHMNTLSGVINNISTDVATVAKVDLAGKVNEFGTAKISGSLKPFNTSDFTDMKLAFTNLDMHKLTPYSGKFAGRRIDSGKMSVDLAYKIKQHQLAGENKFVINKLKLGEKIESKDAADLPLDLAIAILDDNNGIIDLDLPITGDLDNPEFKMGGIVWKAFKNVMTKIVTAPFKALGSLFGGKGGDLESISFEAGNAALQPPEQEKLKALSGALNKRRGLTLAITPHYVATSDSRALQAEMTRERVLKEAGLTSKVGETARPIDLENEVVQAAVKTLHDDFTKKSLFKKLGDKINKPKPDFYSKALEELITNTEVTDADLTLLATQRAEAIQQYLLDANIDKARISINKAKASKDAKVINASLAIGVTKPTAAK